MIQFNQFLEKKNNGTDILSLFLELNLNWHISIMKKNQIKSGLFTINLVQMTDDIIFKSN